MTLNTANIQQQQTTIKLTGNVTWHKSSEVRKFNFYWVTYEDCELNTQVSHGIKIVDTVTQANCLQVYIIMTFTNIKLDLSRYNTYVPTSDYDCFIIIMNVLALGYPKIV